VTDDDWLTAEFEASRPRLRAVAYRMLGSHTEADDAVQDAWLRLSRTDPSRIENLGGFLTTLIGRVCLDRLRTRRARPEESIDEPPHDDRAHAATDNDPASEAVLADSVGAALFVVLDLLAPAERVAFVLHDVFAVPFEQVSEILGRSPDAARQLASRARRRLQGTPTTAELDLVRQRDVVNAFLRAARGGEFDALLRVLDPDVTLVPDAAAVRMGALRETRGAESVAAALSGGAQGAQLAIIDGVAGFVWAPGGHTRGVVQFTINNDKIVAINVTGDAERIRELDIVTIDD
jgi:RNA polymerase sigma-70 factor (ECF subfamily)